MPLLNQQYLVQQPIQTINNLEWDKIWNDNCWVNITSRQVFADLLLANGMAQIGRLHEHIKKMETNMTKLLRNLMSDLEKKCVDHDDPMYLDIDAKLEKLNFQRWEGAV